ncbi:MAG: CPBP family intramembrane metalloprotease [FCB group bacterium]|nr:CPBP family intramembrane metalloprotease [FCB group bacterium]
MSYWQQSRSPLYSLVFTFPLFLVYEAGIFALSDQDLPSLRNGADVLMRRLLESFGLIGLHGFSIAFIIGIIVVFVIQKRSGREVRIHGNTLFFMLVESFIWGGALFGLLVMWQVLFMIPTSRLLIQQVVLAVGAGIYEELVFRVLLITGLAAVLKFIFKWERIARQVGAVIGAAVIFSLFHFVGTFGDVPHIRLFMIRFVAGLLLGGIYSLRGFGITAYAHSIYDLIVLTQMITVH